MGARLINNPRRTKIGHVEAFPVLHMHDHRPILDRLPSRIRFTTGTRVDRNWKLGIEMFFANVISEMNEMQVVRSKVLISRTGINFFQE